MIEKIVEIMKQLHLKNVAYDYSRSEFHVTFVDGTSMTVKETNFTETDLKKLSEKYGTK